MHRLEKRTHANATWDKVVDETSPEAAFLVGPKGGEITEELAKQLGLIGTKNASAGLEDKAAPAAAKESAPATKKKAK